MSVQLYYHRVNIIYIYIYLYFRNMKPYNERKMKTMRQPLKTFPMLAYIESSVMLIEAASHLASTISMPC